MDSPIMTTNALALVRELGTQGANINKIRSLLHTQEGLWFRDDDIIFAGQRMGIEILPSQVANGSDRLPSFQARPAVKRPVDNVRLVAPGSCPVPKGGYKLGMARNG
jgi:hypothetical protein